MTPQISHRLWSGVTKPRDSQHGYRGNHQSRAEKIPYLHDTTFLTYFFINSAGFNLFLLHILCTHCTHALQLFMLISQTPCIVRIGCIQFTCRIPCFLYIFIPTLYGLFSGDLLHLLLLLYAFYLFLYYLIHLIFLYCHFHVFRLYVLPHLLLFMSLTLRPLVIPPTVFSPVHTI